MRRQSCRSTEKEKSTSDEVCASVLSIAPSSCATEQDGPVTGPGAGGVSDPLLLQPARRVMTKERPSVEIKVCRIGVVNAESSDPLTCCESMPGATLPGLSEAMRAEL